MNISLAVPSVAQSVSFSVLTTEDVRRISVKQITNPVLLDDLNRPNVGGLYDPALGPVYKQDICVTCRQTYFSCPGHFATCLFCHHFKLPRAELLKYVAKLRLLEHGMLDAALALNDLHMKPKNKDPISGDEIETETLEAFEQRVQAFVQLNLLRASGSRDNYKHSLVFQARKDLIQDVLKTSLINKCQNSGCGANGYTFRKEGAHKNEKRQRSARLATTVTVWLNKSDVVTVDGSDSDTGESELEGGDPTFSDQESGGHPQREQKNADSVTNDRTKKSRTHEECRAHLRLLFTNERTLCSLMFGRHGPLSPVTNGLSVASADMFFMDVVPVSPTRFRPPAMMGETLLENPHNSLLAKVLTTSYRLRDLNAELRAVSVKSSSYSVHCLATLVQLQVDVNSFIDSGKNPVKLRNGKLPPPGIKQILEKKEGLFRMHMMGKRVNYAARSVISPDVNIEPNEIGVPPVFARKLTFPEPVTPVNFHEMRQLVINGPKIYPGATIVEFEDGHQIYLDKLTVEQRTAIANQLLTPPDGGRSNRHRFTTRTTAINKKVFRHLRDGDMLILNRQPTLHKPSMMAHRARVLHGEKTIRMHYANCGPSLEHAMCTHVLEENEVARAEAMLIANTDNQYLVPTSGKPLRGLIQDHVVAGVWMTNLETFFTREEYFQLLYGSLKPEEYSAYDNGCLLTLPPAIWKPRALWTGKQIISTVLLNITPSNTEGLNLNAKAKVPSAAWGKGSSEDQSFSVALLTKSAFGASDFGLVHSVYELYGADVAGRLLGILSRLFTKFLQHRAFTCRIDDLALADKGNAKRAELLRGGEHLGTEGAMDNFPSLNDLSPEEKPEASRLDMTVKSRLRELTKSIADAVMPHGLLRKFPHNNMQMMTQSGAKGSVVNAQQISCVLGQQELEGRRVPVMVSGKTLPSFKAFETKAIAGGYVASRFLTGIRPQEFFFHCMAGREGLIDTAVKTSRSGYLQRSLIKHLEGIRVHYDNTVRGSDGSVYQFHYGGDALDVTRQKHLCQFTFMAQNMKALIDRYRPRDAIDVLDDEQARKYTKSVLKASKEIRAGEDLSKRDRMPTPMELFSPARFLGSTSEKFAERLNDYIKSNPDNLLKSKSDVLAVRRRHALRSANDFRLMMMFKYLRSLVDPGEAVGLLAGQGVGEPSTQMTLNTFHFAGHGAANVTLGIPRVPKTPSMTITIAKGVSVDRADAFARRASRVTISQVVDKVSINNQARRKQFTIDIEFYPEEEYRAEFEVSPPQLVGALGTRFSLILKHEIQVEMRKLAADLKSQIADLGKGRAAPRGEEGTSAAAGEEDADAEEPPTRRDDDEDSEVGDGDASREKRHRQKQQQTSYESDEDEDEDEDGDGDVNLEPLEVGLEAGHTSGAVGAAVELEKQPRKKAGLREVVQRAEQAFLENFANATAFKFTPSGCKIELEFGSDLPKLLLVGIVERTCTKTVVREIPGIADCFRVKEASKDGLVKITTNGSSLRGLWEFACATEEPLIEEDDVYSNDIYSILMTYGIEMARAAIVQEISGVFGVYNIEVDIRHLELIADYMTFEGDYKPFNRKGMSMHPSPLLKASFETTGAFLSDATLHGDFDDLQTPSSNLVVGRPGLSGTGVFDVVTRSQLPMSIMSPPRPVLADLPLDLILNPNSDHPTRGLNRSISLTGSKRSRSPSLARSIFSPAKRRILEQEGLILTSRSRLRTSTSIHSLSRALLHASDDLKHLPAPSFAKGDAPLPTPIHPDLLDPPSPREPRRSSPRLSASPNSKSCSSATTTPTRTSPRKSHPQTTTAGSSSSSSRPVRHTMVPREMPPPPDRRSVHYPGFDVHQDTHIALPCTRSMTRAREEAARAQEGEAAKENVRPAAGAIPCKSSKAKGDMAPRRSARLRASNTHRHSPPQGAFVLDMRGREHRRSALYGVSLKV
ncbi:beta and beta-prime subunits of DNA dependent RNA-polymerase [Lactarius indigo]|nr:beta and beta-prime subunits of DNA dependent RNA-polymerase [Lactarius indigo]